MQVKSISPTSLSTVATVSIKDGNVIKEAPVQAEAFQAQTSENMIKPLIVVDENGNAYQAEVTATGSEQNPQMELVYVAPKNAPESETFFSKIPWWAWLILALAALYGANKAGLFKTGK